MKTIQKAYPERLLAEQRGEKTYFTGRPCKQGHIAERWTADSGCMECRRQTRLRLKTIGHDAAYMRDKRAAMTTEELAAYRAKEAAGRRRRRAENPEPIRALERKHGKLKRQRYPQRKLADTRRRQAAKMLRTPVWSELEAIRQFYENCPPGHEVDHIAPLRGRTVSGLHVLANLQYLPVEINRRKNSTFDADAFSAAELQRWRANL